MKKIKLGDYIEPVVLKNNNKYSEQSVRGISIKKVFTSTKADLSGVSLSNFNIVPVGCFAFNPNTARMGDKICVALNDSNQEYLVSAIYPVFKVKDEKRLISRYLMMFFNRPEFDRYVRFNSWGSARETFNYSDFCEIEMILPSPDIQEKYVAIYESLLANLAAFEQGIDDLKLVCDGYIEKLKKQYELFPIGNYISARNEKNVDEQIKLEQGINIKKEFISPQRSNSNLRGRKIVRTGDIAYCTQLNNENVAIAIREGNDCVVSSVYDVFYVTKPEELNPKYLLLWLLRKEFGRYVYWKSTGTSYEFLDYQNIVDYRIPIPEKPVQDAIVKIFESMRERIGFRDKVTSNLSNICPVLIRGSVLEARGR